MDGQRQDETWRRRRASLLTDLANRNARRAARRAARAGVLSHAVVATAIRAGRAPLP